SGEIIKPFLSGRDIKAYQKPIANQYLIFTRRGININDYPAIKEHLQRFKTRLMPKPAGFKGDKLEGRKSGSYKWYEVQDSIDYYLEFEKPKIIYPNILKRPEFTFDSEGLYTNQKCFIISLDDKFLLGILNSSVAYYLYDRMFPKLRGGFFEPSYVFMKHLPIPTPVKHQRIANDIESIVNTVLLESNISVSLLQRDEALLKNHVDYLLNKLNQLVYQLYGLTEEEIQIIEDAIR
ncbi:partial Modification methylase PaeR7I, partial [Patescibacteria group bacterium]